LLDLAVRMAQACATEADAVVVSTDIPVYRAPIGVTLLPRPSALATAKARIVDEAQRVARLYPDQDPIVLLQPTSPCRSEDLVRSAIAAYRDADSPTAVVTVQETKPGHYVRDGSVYVTSRQTLLEHGDFYGTRTIYLVNPEVCVNIDTEADWVRAQAAYQEVPQYAASR